MNTKAITEWKRYKKDYTDDFGMFCLYLWKGQYDNENPHLFTGEMNVLLHLLSIYDAENKKNIKNYLEYTEVTPGLHRRRREEDSRSTVSHDEYSGIMFMTMGNRTLRDYADNIVKYGKKYNWQYNDNRPERDGLKYALKHPLKAFKYFRRLAKGDESVRENNPDLDALSYIRQPRDICFYKIVSTITEPNWFERLYLALTVVITGFRNKNYKNGGTKLIAWYRMKVIEYYKQNTFILSLAHKFFIRKLKKQYGVNYLESLHFLYYKDKNHPIHSLVKEINEN